MGVSYVFLVAQEPAFCTHGEEEWWLKTDMLYVQVSSHQGATGNYSRRFFSISSCLSLAGLVAFSMDH